MTECINLLSIVNHRDLNRRFLERFRLVDINGLRLLVNEFLEDNKKELKQLVNNPRKVSYAKAIYQAHQNLKRQVFNVTFPINIRYEDKIMDMICHFKKIVLILLNSDSNVKSQNFFNFILFDTAITTGCINIIKSFLDLGLDVNLDYNTIMDSYCIPLHRAAQNRQKETVEFLIRSGADVNMVNEFGKTALFYAAKIGDLSTVELLLRYNAQINDPDILTASILSKSLRVIELLIKRGANVNQRDLCGRTPLHFVSSNKKCLNFSLQFRSRDSVRAKMAHILIQNGADVNAKTTSGITPLHAAALKGYFEVTEILLINGAIVDEPFKNKKTALFYAAYNAQPQVVRVLLKHGADINILDKRKRSALHMARNPGITKYVMICDRQELKTDIVLKSHLSLENDENDEYDLDVFDISICGIIASYKNRNETIKILSRHIIKMITAKMFVHKKINNLINMSKINSFRKVCKQELRSMKHILLINHFTAFDIIQMDLDILAIHTKNPDIRDILQRYNYICKFPHYGTIIQTRIQAAIKREAALSKDYDTSTFKVIVPRFVPSLSSIFTQPLLKYFDRNSTIRTISVFNQLYSL